MCFQRKWGWGWLASQLLATACDHEHPYPQVCSCGTGLVEGKSWLLNTLYGLTPPQAFATAARSVLHDGSVDVLLDTPWAARGHAVADCHGDMLLYGRHLRALAPLTCVLLLQVSVGDLVDVMRWRDICDCIAGLPEGRRALAIALWGTRGARAHGGRTQAALEELAVLCGATPLVLHVDQGSEVDMEGVQVQYHEWLQRIGLTPSLTKAALDRAADAPVPFLRQVETPRELAQARAHIHEQVLLQSPAQQRGSQSCGVVEFVVYRAGGSVGMVLKDCGILTVVCISMGFPVCLEGLGDAYPSLKAGVLVPGFPNQKLIRGCLC